MKIGVSLCGGGAMGCISAIIAQAITIETGLKMNQLANAFAGTSIGGVLSLAYSIGHVPDDEVIDIFTEYADDVFKKNGVLGIFAATYGNEGLIEVMNKYFGAYKLHDCKVPTTVTARNYQIGNLYINSEEMSNLPAVHAAIATASAPMYFKPYPFESYDKKYIAYDGGLFAQNPSDILLADFVAKEISPKEVVIVNIGTGFSRESQDKIKNPNKLKTVKLVIDECLDSQIDHVTRNMQKFIGNRYINFDFEVAPEINQMDKIEYIQEWIRLAKNYVKSAEFQENIYLLKQYLTKNDTANS